MGGSGGGSSSGNNQNQSWQGSNPTAGQGQGGQQGQTSGGYGTFAGWGSAQSPMGAGFGGNGNSPMNPPPAATPPAAQNQYQAFQQPQQNGWGSAPSQTSGQYPPYGRETFVGPSYGGWGGQMPGYSVGALAETGGPGPGAPPVYDWQTSGMEKPLMLNQEIDRNSAALNQQLQARMQNMNGQEPSKLLTGTLYDDNSSMAPNWFNRRWADQSSSLTGMPTNLSGGLMGNSLSGNGVANMPVDLNHAGMMSNRMYGMYGGPGQFGFSGYPQMGQTENMSRPVQNPTSMYQGFGGFGSQNMGQRGASK